MILDKIIEKLDKDLRDRKNCGDKDDIYHFRKLAERADKISFGQISLELDEDTKKGYKIPTLDENEKQWWNEGLIPLPSDICWYEFSMDCEGIGGSTIQQGIMIIKHVDSGNIMCQCIDLYTKRSSLIPGVWFRDNGDGTQQLSTAVDIKLTEKQLEASSRLWGHSATMVKYLTLMLNSKSTDIVNVTVKSEQNRLRRLLNKNPLSDHRVVTIIPKRYIDEAVRDGRGTHASPKLHSRRSHIRTLHRGEPNEKRIVIPRFWVGKRELGVITKEYKVKI